MAGGILEYWNTGILQIYWKYIGIYWYILSPPSAVYRHLVFFSLTQIGPVRILGGVTNPTSAKCGLLLELAGFGGGEEREDNPHVLPKTEWKTENRKHIKQSRIGFVEPTAKNGRGEGSGLACWIFFDYQFFHNNI